MGRGEGAALWTRETRRGWYCASAVEGCWVVKKQYMATTSDTGSTECASVVASPRRLQRIKKHTEHGRIEEDAVHRLGRGLDTAGSHLEW